MLVQELHTRLFLVLGLILGSCASSSPLAPVSPVSAVSAGSAPPTASVQRPNIIFIYSDDHAAAAVGAYGSSAARTPNLDRLAAEGLLFENAFCTNALCAPARAVVLTGKHSHRNGLMDNGDRFDGAQWTFPKALGEAGYQTALLGKWHLKSEPTGFDHWEVLPGQGHYYGPEFKTPQGLTRHEGYNTDVVMDRTLAWLDGKRDPKRPFMVMCQFKAPHRTWMPGPDHLSLYDGVLIPEPTTLFDDWASRATPAHAQEMTIADHLWLAYDLKVPLQAGVEATGPDKWAEGLLGRMSAEQRIAWEAAYGPRNRAFRNWDLSGRALVQWKYQRYIKDYLRCIASIDDNIGRLLDWLDEEGLADNTVVIYTSDQGFFLGEHGWYDKRFMYEPSLRFPLIVRWPAATEGNDTGDARDARDTRGTRETRLVQNLDFAATMLDLAGLAARQDLDGVSLLPLLRGAEPKAWRASIYYEYFEEGIHNVPPHYGVRTQRWKLIHYPKSDEWELFDLALDPEEVDNLAGQPEHHERERQLGDELARLRRACGR
ncbi:MAG: sulfatase [Planctomycetota bacterium]|nr:sulfatase [Planctomycetota bacterium]